MARNHLTRWLLAPVAKGRLALLFGLFAVGFPTMVRAAVNGQVTGCEFTPYLPFVLLSAIVIGWWQAGIVALASVAVLGGLFAGLPDQFLVEACAQSASGIFLGSSAIIIGIVAGARSLLAEIYAQRLDEANGGIVFSLEKGEVWASWYGSGPPMRLGPQRKVEAMMEDFLAQGKLGKRLSKERK